jgi:hypothetical protein
MMNDRTFPIPSNTISVKSEDYTNKSLQMDSNPATMEVSGASCRSVRAKFSAYSRVIRKAGCASHAQKSPRFWQMCKRCAESVQPLSYIKKERQILRFDVQYLVHLAHSYPNFSLLLRLPQKRPFPYLPYN